MIIYNRLFTILVWKSGISEPSVLEKLQPAPTYWPIGSRKISQWIRFLGYPSKWVHVQPQSEFFKYLDCICHWLLLMMKIYHLVMSHIAMERSTIFKNGKPSISMGHLFHGYVSHNQRVRSPAVRYIQHCSEVVWSPSSQSPASSRGAILAKLADHLVRPKLRLWYCLVPRG